MSDVDYTINSFAKMIKGGMIKRTDAGMTIQLKNIHNKTRADGSPWNRRDMESVKTQLNVKSIAKHIMKGGAVPAVEVQIRDGGGVVKIDGHCRVEGYRIADGSGTGDVWVPITPFKGDELDCLIRIDTSNRDEKLSPLELMDLYVSIREELRAMGEKGTLQQIADRVNITRQYVDQILKLEKLDDEGKKLVADGKVTVAQAVKAVRDDAEASTVALKAAATANASKDKARAEPKPVTVAPALLSDMFTMTSNLRRSLRPDTAAAAEEFLRGERPATDKVYVEVGHLARLVALHSEGERQLEVKASKAKAKVEEGNQEPIDLDAEERELVRGAKAIGGDGLQDPGQLTGDATLDASTLGVSPDLGDEMPPEVRAKLDRELAHVDPKQHDEEFAFLG